MRTVMAVVMTIALPASAQDVPPNPDPTRSVALENDPGNRMTVPVFIGGKGPYPFLIDTGAQRTFLSHELAVALALPLAGPVRIISLSGPADLPTARVAHLRYGEEEVRDIITPLVARADLGGAGILGLDGLHGKTLVIDILATRMDVRDSRERTEAEEQEGDSIVVRARSRMGQLILVNCRVGEASTRVILDTGAEYSIGNMALLRRLRADRLTRGPQPATLISVLGDSVEAQIAVVKTMTVGGITIRDVPVIFTDADPFRELGLSDKPAMLMGMQIVRLFDRVTIDFAHRQVDFTMPTRRIGQQAAR